MRGGFELDRVVHGSLELGPVVSQRFFFISLRYTLKRPVWAHCRLGLPALITHRISAYASNEAAKNCLR
jgi:hypothetical protein